MNPKLIIFDFDGVIVNSEDIFLNVLYNTLIKHGINISFKECYNLCVGNDTFSILQKIVQLYNSNTSAAEIYKSLLENKNKWSNGVVKVPYIKEVLEQLTIPFCIASNSSLDHIYNILNIVKLNSFFKKENIFSAVEIGLFKPNPGVYLEALNKMGYEPKEAIAIEDSPPGITAAVKAGIPTIGLISSNHVDPQKHSEVLKKGGAFTTITNLKEVLSLIK